MCGRFTLTWDDPDALCAELGIAEGFHSDYRPRFNIAPLQSHFIVTTEYENRLMIPARWGLVPHWAKDASRASQCINAKAETVEALPSFREAFRKRRCIIPADGFYEWRGPKGKREPLWIHPRNGKLLRFAGLYEAWQKEPGQWETTFTIITCPPNAAMASIHNRMPVILADREAEDWMNPRESDPPALKRLLAPAPEDLLVIQPASPLVNNVRNDGPELLKASPAGLL
jgi:putative SOS response-associated peptidase YedK